MIDHPMMKCERLRATVSVSTCAARSRIANGQKHEFTDGYDFRDQLSSCKSCPIGIENAKRTVRDACCE